MAIARYQKRISGPLLDRIDIHVEVPRVDYEKLADKRSAETSETIRKRVQAARGRQLERFKGTPVTCNTASADSVLLIMEVDIPVHPATERLVL